MSFSLLTECTGHGGRVRNWHWPAIVSGLVQEGPYQFWACPEITLVSLPGSGGHRSGCRQLSASRAPADTPEGETLSPAQMCELRFIAINAVSDVGVAVADALAPSMAQKPGLASAPPLNGWCGRRIARHRKYGR